jgi:hypothetical protein
MHASGITKPPPKKAEFLPAIGANRQNAHLRDFKYTPENIEKYLNQNMDKNKAKKHLVMDYSCTV